MALYAKRKLVLSQSDPEPRQDLLNIVSIVEGHCHKLGRILCRQRQAHIKLNALHHIGCQQHRCKGSRKTSQRSPFATISFGACASNHSMPSNYPTTVCFHFQRVSHTTHMHSTAADAQMSKSQRAPQFMLASADETKMTTGDVARTTGIPAWRTVLGNVAAGATAGCAVEAGKLFSDIAWSLKVPCASFLTENAAVPHCIQHIGCHLTGRSVTCQMGASKFASADVICMCMLEF